MDHKKNQWSCTSKKKAKLKLIHSDNHQWECQWNANAFQKFNFHIICAALLRCAALFFNECSQEYSKAATKSSLKEIKASFLSDVASMFGLSFNKVSFSLVTLPDTTGACKFSTQ